MDKINMIRGCNVCLCPKKWDVMAYNGQIIHLWRNGTPGLIMGKVYIYGGLGRQGL